MARPRKIRMKKSLSRKLYGRAKRGMRNPKQVGAKMARNRARRRRR